MCYTTPPARLGASLLAEKIPKGALMSYFVTLVRRFAEKAEGFPPTASAVCPQGGKDRGEKISPGASVVTTKCRSKRRGQGREAAKRTLDRMSGVGRRETDAARGKFPLVEWRENSRWGRVAF